MPRWEKCPQCYQATIFNSGYEKWTDYFRFGEEGSIFELVSFFVKGFIVLFLIVMFGQFIIEFITDPQITNLICK